MTALMLYVQGQVIPDREVCQVCDLSVHGQMPAPQPLDPAAPGYSIDKGQPGDLCPPCCKSQLSNVAHWQGHRGDVYPAHLEPLRLFKCAWGYWMVVPGLYDDIPTVLDQERWVRSQVEVKGGQ